MSRRPSNVKKLTPAPKSVYTIVMVFVVIVVESVEQFSSRLRIDLFFAESMAAIPCSENPLSYHFFRDSL